MGGDPRQNQFPNYRTKKSISRNTYRGDKFPSDIGSVGLMMNFKDYSYASSFRASTNSGGELARSVMFPIPANLADNIAINVGQGELGSGGSAVLDFLSDKGTSEAKNAYINGMNAVSGLSETLGKSFVENNWEDLLGDLKKSIGNANQVAKYFGRSVVDQFVPGASLAFDLNTATAVNPHVTLNFDGVGLKKHSFEWIFSPKNREESDNLRNIINQIKAEAHPRTEAVVRGAGGSLERGLLKYPSLVDMFFVGVSASHFYEFKPCMISNITANYAPQGIALNRGGVPAIVTLQIEFQEATIHTSNDFDEITEFEG